MRVPARKFLIASASVAAATAAAVPAYAVVSTPTPRVTVTSAPVGGVAGQYIVTLKHAGARPARMAGLPMLHRFDDGFSAHLTSAQLKALRSDPNVAAIEQDQVVRVDGTQKNPTWGLDRIDERKRPLSHSYTYKHNGAGVNVYVIDTGIDTSLGQFGGRADTVYGPGGDCFGHGTHVAGIIGSRSYGVAKGARLHSVRVFKTCSNETTNAAVIAGINWVAKHHGARAVANISLGSAKSTAVDSAVTKLSKSGVFVAVSAGNDARSACTKSPAGAAGAETVAASASNDTRADFSNYGSCVDVYAPGVGIKSTYPGGSAYMDGTSMATPFVAGVAALYKSAYGQHAFGTVHKWIHSHATTGVIRNNKAGTPNRLLYKSSL